MMTKFRPVVLEGKDWKITFTIESKDQVKGFKIATAFRDWIAYMVKRHYGANTEVKDCGCSGS